jgi:glycosyltransferase involved in cell wall biosynthesis
MPAPTLSIIIPAYNEERYIRKCLESVVRCRTDAVKEVIVVDNASTDRTAEVASSFPGIQVMKETRKGTGFARQRGYNAATGDVLVFLDADSTIDKAWLERIEEIFLARPHMACLTGPYRFDVAPCSVRVIAWLYWRLLAFPLSKITGKVAVAGNMAILHSALERIGGFNTSIAFFGDDTNLACRLQKVGEIRFDLRLLNTSSYRRIQKEGLMRTGMRYAINFSSQLLVRKSVNRMYEDIR